MCLKTNELLKIKKKYKLRHTFYINPQTPQMLLMSVFFLKINIFQYKSELSKYFLKKLFIFRAPFKIENNYF